MKSDAMRRVMGLACLAVSMAWVSSAYAALEWSSPGFVPPELEVILIEVGALQPEGPGNVFVVFSKPPFAGQPCSSSDQWLVGGGSENVARVLAILTAAKLSQRKVKILRDGSCSLKGVAGYGPNDGYPVLLGVAF